MALSMAADLYEASAGFLVLVRSLVVVLVVMVLIWLVLPLFVLPLLKESERGRRVERSWIFRTPPPTIQQDRKASLSPIVSFSSG